MNRIWTLFGIPKDLKNQPIDPKEISESSERTKQFCLTWKGFHKLHVHLYHNQEKKWTFFIKTCFYTIEGPFSASLNRFNIVLSKIPELKLPVYNAPSMLCSHDQGETTVLLKGLAMMIHPNRGNYLYGRKIHVDY